MDVSTLQNGDKDCRHSTFLKNQNGFSLLELISTIMVVGALISVIPGVSAALIYSNKVASAVNSIASDMSYARSEAIMRNQNVQLCKSLDGERCIKAKQWETGWIIFVDKNKNRRREETEEILKYRPFNSINITYKGSGSSHYIRFRADGATGVNGTFSFCSDTEGVYKKALILFRTGRLRLSDTRTRGRAISCSGFRN